MMADGGTLTANRPTPPPRCATSAKPCRSGCPRAESGSLLQPTTRLAWSVGTTIPLWDNGPGGRSAVKSPVLPTGDNRPAREEPILEQQEPVVTESALADALDQLVNLIEELRVDVNLRVEITTDDTQLLKLNFSGTPDVGFSLQGEVRDIPGVVVRRVWNEGLRDYDTLYRSGNSV